MHPQTITAGELLSRHVSPNHCVLCVGAYRGPYQDPSPLFLSTLVSQGKGRVHIPDAQSQSKKLELEGRELMGGCCLLAHWPENKKSEK